MNIRKMALALALPAALGFACSTSQSSRTARAEGTAPAPAGTEATTEGSPGARGGDAEGGAVATTPGQTGTGTAQDDGTLTGERTAGMSSDLKGHASDQVVMGTVASVSSGSLSISSDMGGAARTLQVVPETIITVDGREGRIADIKEGEQIRASFNEQDGRNVAVKIEAGPMTGGHMGSDMGTTGTGTGTTTDMGAPGSSPTGSSSTSDTGTHSGSTGTSGTGTGGGYDTSGTSR